MTKKERPPTPLLEKYYTIIIPIDIKINNNIYCLVFTFMKLVYTFDMER